MAGVVLFFICEQIFPTFVTGPVLWRSCCWHK
jgi:hypothetical protein